MNLRLPVVSTVLLLCAQSGAAQQHSTTLGLTVRVVRSCAVHTDAGADAPVQLTCSRNATPGVVTNGSSGVTPVPPMQSTSIRVAAAPAPASAVVPLPGAAAGAPGVGDETTGIEPAAEGRPETREVVTINF